MNLFANPPARPRAHAVLHWLLLAGLLAAVRLAAADSLAGRRPNLVFILTDDQGYGDMSCHGHPVLRTPNLDRLHREGARFVDFHVSPTCAPTRSALLTGRHEFRNGVTHTILHNGTFEKTRGYCTDVFFAQSLRWMESVKGRKPFFAYIACNAPHAPLQVRPEDEARYAGKVANTNGVRYLGMVANIDDNVGRLLERLAAWGIERETLVVFMNDNGADGGLLAGYNAGMRGAKGTAFLGGTRAASFWRWPGTLVPGDRGALAAHIDFFPTIAEIAGAKPTRKVRAQVEGRSLVPVLQDPAAPWPERTLFTHVGRWPKGADPETAKFRACSVRTPRWHLVSPDGAREPRWMLFDVSADPGEKNDLISGHPEVVADLAGRYDAWWSSVRGSFSNERAVGPAINPFKARYWRQFGGGPSAEDLRLMDPEGNPATRGQGAAQEGRRKKGEGRP